MRKRFHGLKRPKIRQSWNKYNLYNLSQLRRQEIKSRTFFQQKWTAKAMTRAYHGEQVREKQWQRMFRPRLASVVPMDHRYLAQFDGSEQALGRGSGLDVSPDMAKTRARKTLKTPYMNMVYAPMERRLDTAIFRALFASSARQARQFVVHGFVRVNGERARTLYHIESLIIYPGYMLNPGDMFQVEPDRVLFATGAPKSKPQRRAGRLKAKKAPPPSDTTTEPAAADDELDLSTLSISEPLIEGTESPIPVNPITTILARARTTISSIDESSLTAKQKQAFRSLKKSAKTLLSQGDSAPAFSIPALEAELSNFTTLLAPPADSIPIDHQARKGAAALEKKMEKLKENPTDPSKPYGTPWRPRDFMSAFAFIPRYLEVNQNICAAVYLRHPVAKPGLAEVSLSGLNTTYGYVLMAAAKVPTPFNQETYQLAFNWYLRRGR
ncbi:MAG: mitochondrial 37S ribosomal protein nam9 [Geoglossum simile]|nr:MAG: mitochondrial 37S ribosomal protein nam9 [Geoglossum simile]